MNRRQFLSATAGTAAIGFAGLASFAAVRAGWSPAGLVDVNITVGRWPTRRLPLEDTARLVAKLRDHGVTQAWAGSFEAAFGRALAAANARLVNECRKHGRGLLLPFGSVNLALPDWEAEFNCCVENHRMRGLRLFPNYHGYLLDAPAFGKLLCVATEKKLVVEIAADLEDERTQPLSASVPHVDARPLLGWLKSLPSARVVLLNWSRAVPPELVKQLAALGVGFDLATVEGVGGVAELLGKISAERVLFGSHAPFFYFESAELKLKESALSAEPVRAVCELNARRLLA